MRTFVKQFLGSAGPPAPPEYLYYRFTFSGTARAQFSFIVGHPGIGAFAAANAVGTNLFNGASPTPLEGANWTGGSTNIYLNSFSVDLPYSTSPTYLTAQLGVAVPVPASFYFSAYSGDPSWNFTITGTITIAASNDGVVWDPIKVAAPMDFVLIETVGGATSYYVNVD